MYESYVPLWAVMVSMVAVVPILLSSRRPNLREFWTVGAALVKFGLVLSLLPGAIAGRIAHVEILQVVEGVELALRVDPLGIFFALVASGLWILTSVYSIGYVRGLNEKKQTRYFTCFAVCLSSTIGIAFSANIVTFIVFYEILTIATYPLIIHEETPEALRSGRKYLFYTLTAGVVLMAAAAWTHRLAGGLDFVPGGLLRGVDAPASTIRILFLLFIGGVGVKAAIMPLHAWLPAAMVAPTPVSALLHAVAVVKSGVFGVVRVVGFVFGPQVMQSCGVDQALMVAAAITIIVASIMALAQDNLKMRLAYSTVGHLSYVVLGAAILSPEAFTGGVLHIASHATMKITLFFCAGAIYVNVHRQNISELDGIGRAMPWTMGAFAVGSIGLAGLPPVNGFVSKWYLGLGAVGAGHKLALAVFLVSGLLNAAYLFPIVHRAFFRGSNQYEGEREASPLMVVPLVITALLSVFFCLWPNGLVHLYDLAVMITGSVFGGGL
ncbi:MAG: monovalent cation/H+ antiporter subunit D family protein [Candidatus Latescibacteria bacterium]|nr:monovalent cation/H+ antiporter subunit D family protein [Candidatus Latescibacterota bacterium]